MRIVNDPFRLLIKIAKDKYPHLKAKVAFTNEMPKHGMKKEPCGVTLWPEGAGTPEILIHAGIPVSGAVEVLAHEIAHLIAGHDSKHGPKWRKAFNWMHRRYCEEVEANGR